MNNSTIKVDIFHSLIFFVHVCLCPSLSLSLYLLQTFHRCHVHTQLSLSLPLPPQFVPSCQSAPCSSPSCLPSPYEPPHNNAGQGSRERTGCTYNGPEAPTKTIAPFLSGAFFFFLSRDGRTGKDKPKESTEGGREGEERRAEERRAKDVRAREKNVFFPPLSEKLLFSVLHS